MKIGIISHKCYNGKDETIKRTIMLIEKAVRNGANLIVLQELHQGEYFCQNEDVKCFDLAEDFSSDVAYWSEVAREFGVVVVSSLFEKRTAGVYHNTAVVFEKNGEIAGKYRKMHIPDDPNFHEKFYFTPGDLGFEPIKTSLGKLGVMVCWDQWYPEAARIMALKGAEILIYPTAIGWFDSDEVEEKQRQLESWVAVQRGHAIANGLPVVAVNRVGFESSMTKGEDGIRFWGNSFVFGAGGEELFRANHYDELAEVIEVDLKKSEKLRCWWPFLRDRRIDAYEEILKRFID